MSNKSNNEEEFFKNKYAYAMIDSDSKKGDSFYIYAENKEKNYFDLDKDEIEGIYLLMNKVKKYLNETFDPICHIVEILSSRGLEDEYPRGFWIHIDSFYGYKK
tara:strand:+ start:389 stop:700 length:312 start_codon:yes stop_codon:yes gene_type:complete